MRRAFWSVYGSSDRLFWDSDHRFSALSVSGSAKWCGKDGKIAENCGKNNFFYHRKVEKHRTSLRQTSVLLWQNIGTFCQRSPMFCFFRWKTCRNSPFQVCDISDLACCLLPSEALHGAFQKRLQRLMSVNLASMKLLHTHGCLRTSGLWSVRDCRLWDTKNSPSRCVAGWGAGEENPIVSDGRCSGHCSASRCRRWPTRASSLPCGARRDGPKGGRAR